LDALAKGLLSDPHVTSARVLGTNFSTGVIINSVWWNKKVGGLGEPVRIEEEGVAVGVKPDSSYPW
jgi:G protein-coupled receptor 158